MSCKCRSADQMYNCRQYAHCATQRVLAGPPQLIPSKESKDRVRHGKTAKAKARGHVPYRKNNKGSQANPAPRGHRRGR